MSESHVSLETVSNNGAQSVLLPRGRQVDFTQLSEPSRWRPEFAVPFNQRVIGKRILISNDFGDWLLLAHDEFRDFIEGRPQPGEALYESSSAPTSSPGGRSVRPGRSLAQQEAVPLSTARPCTRSC
jgi:hypothetical protein